MSEFIDESGALCRYNYDEDGKRIIEMLGPPSELYMLKKQVEQLENDIEKLVERKCVYDLPVDSGGEPYEDWEASCGACYSSDTDYEQPGDGDCIYCPKCGGKIEVVKKVVDDE